jgi:peptidyl-prolyl cis-trans isomerase SurA
MRLRYFFTLFALLAWPVSTSVGLPAAAQSVQRIAAIVNDDVISGYDVERRVEMVIRSTRMTDTPENRRQLRARVLELLIDEKLQLQAAARQNIVVTDDEMQLAFRAIERQNRMTPGSFDGFVASIGINRDTLLQQIRARLAWNKVVLRKLPQIQDDEVDEAMGRASANVGKPEYRIAEILIPIDSPNREAEARQSATELLKQIGGGVSFEAAAREFSRGATAADGGDVGWVLADQLDPDVASSLTRLPVGGISEPIRARAGYYLIRLIETRKFGLDGPVEAKLTLHQVMFNLRDNASQAETRQVVTRARAFAADAGGCETLESDARRADGADYVNLGSLTASQLAPAVRDAVRSLPDSKLSEPVVTPVGVMLLMICGRSEPPKPKGPAGRDAIIGELHQKRMAQVAQRHIRDLRRDAVVEYR